MTLPGEWERWKWVSAKNVMSHIKKYHKFSNYCNRHGAKKTQ